VDDPPEKRVAAARRRGLPMEDVAMAADPIYDDHAPQHVKQVSRIKHIILQKYLPSCEVVLGSKNRRLC
jgi:hypothetical protein